MSKLLGKRRKTYIWDLICNIFYFWGSSGRNSRPVQWGEISAPWRGGLSVYQWSIPEKNKQSRSPQTFLCLSRKFWKNRRSQQVWFHKRVLHPLKIPKPKKRTPKLCGFFVDNPCKFDIFSNLLQEIQQNFCLGFLLEKSNLERCLGYYEWWMRTACGSKAFKNLKNLKRFSTFLLILEKKTAYLQDFQGKKNGYS